MKSRSREIGYLNCRIALKFDRCLSSTDAEVPVKFQSNRGILNQTLTFETSRDLAIKRLTQVLSSQSEALFHMTWCFSQRPRLPLYKAERTCMGPDVYLLSDHSCSTHCHCKDSWNSNATENPHIASLLQSVFYHGKWFPIDYQMTDYPFLKVPNRWHGWGERRYDVYQKWLISNFVLQSWHITSSYGLTYWVPDKMADISQTTLSNVSSWRKIYEFWLIFHWRVKLAIFHHWFR